LNLSVYLLERNWCR